MVKFLFLAGFLFLILYEISGIIHMDKAASNPDRYDDERFIRTVSYGVFGFCLMALCAILRMTGIA